VKNKTTQKQSYDRGTIENIIKRAHYLANQMIYMANNRSDKEKGDPKVGGHSSGSTSCIHILGALHLVVKSAFDHIANKPHASPADHSFNFLLDLFLKPDLTRMSLEDGQTAMRGLRAFSKNGEPVFQSYHSAFDPDHHNFYPSGTVGIPAVNAGYMALAYRYAKKHGYEVPEHAHFWCILGDSEFREGSLFEAIPDFAERELGNLTWIVDYNRQSLDGHRLSNHRIYGGTDGQRIHDTMKANGWEVFEAKHGRKRLELFARPGGEKFQKWFEDDLDDYELQAILNVKDPKKVRDHILKTHGDDLKGAEKWLKDLTDAELFEMLRDFGGHDIDLMVEILNKTKENPDRPSLVIAHTMKGWGLEMAAVAGNHSMLPEDDEMVRLRDKQSISAEALFERFPANTKEGEYCLKRGNLALEEIKAQHALKEKNKAKFLAGISEVGDIPETLDINTKMANYPHTQWMLGQLTSKMTRIANTSTDAPKDAKQKGLTEFEKMWKLSCELMISMAPDVGTSTNLNPSMDGKVFSADWTPDVEATLDVRDDKAVDLVPGQEVTDRFLRFEIAEGNAMSCVGSFGRMRDTLGIPILPLMTVYDFFIKRAHDQYFYNLYWKSSFILVGTPSGVTLSPEGAQHGWKSDFQIPNQITWEPFFIQELDWIYCDAIKRHMLYQNEGRSGVLIRGVTRGADQKDLLKNLRTQRRFKTQDALLHPAGAPVSAAPEAVDESTIEPMADAEIMAQLRQDVLSGAYYLIDYRGYAGYEPGDNVVQIFAMGSLGTEAIKASQELLAKGIYANVIMVTSSDLLIGQQGHENDYQYLRHGLQINSTLFLQPTLNGHLQTPEVATLSGRRVPIVSVHDGEPGLLDNIGSIIGVRHESLAVRKHSKCGRPHDIYKYHHIDAPSIVEACGKVLSETALETVQVGTQTLAQIQGQEAPKSDWRTLWTSSGGSQGDTH
jgi:pyruvate dehydrogenase E1 component